MSKSIAYKHYVRALSRWPKDNLRPDCQFQDVMQKRLDKRFLAASSPNATTGIVDEKMELEQANVLYTLLENRYTRTYPITGPLMKPSSNPTHYEDLMKELEEAPERNWWSSMTNRWKGFLRLK